VRLAQSNITPTFNEVVPVVTKRGLLTEDDEGQRKARHRSSHTGELTNLPSLNRLDITRIWWIKPWHYRIKNVLWHECIEFNRVVVYSWHQWFNQKRIQAYMGYYVASKLRFFTPGLIHWISSRDGCYLVMGCLPLNITNIYFIFREWVHQYNGHGRGAIDLVYHGSPLLGHRQACMDQRQ
jgi:hypothetical protein